MNIETANYFKTSDGEQIFYSTNFDSKELKDNENVLMFNYG